MVVPEYLDDGNLIRQYSNEGYYIRQVETGEIYEDAVDVVPCRYTYEETDEKIPVIEEPDESNYDLSNQDLINPFAPDAGADGDFDREEAGDYERDG